MVICVTDRILYCTKPDAGAPWLVPSIISFSRQHKFSGNTSLGTYQSYGESTVAILVITVWTCSRFPTSLPTPIAWSWRGPHQSWQSHWPWFLAQVNLCSRVLAFLDTAQSHFQDSLVTWSVILAEIMCLCVRWVQYIQEMRPTKVVHYNFQLQLQP